MMSEQSKILELITGKYVDGFRNDEIKLVKDNSHKSWEEAAESLVFKPAEYEDEAERYEHECIYCKTCDNCMNYDPTCRSGFVIDCRNAKEWPCCMFKPIGYCSSCGRKLV